MKNLLITLIAVIAVATMVVTCPDKESHLTAINNEVTTVIDNKVNEQDFGDIKNEGDKALEQGIKLFASTFAGGLAKTMIEQKLIVHNYFVCSIGTINTDEGSKTLSIGLLGHVFPLINAEKIKESLN